MTIPAITVRPGQIWQDNDPRAEGRRVRVVELTGTHAIVELHSPRADYSPRGAGYPPAKPGRRTRIRLDRFRPTNSGYTLVEDVNQ